MRDFNSDFDGSDHRSPARAEGGFWRSWLGPLRPDLSGRGLARLAARCSIAAITIAIMAVLADWSARGFLDRGGLDRLISAKAANTTEARAMAKNDRPLDRGRMKAVATAAGRP